MKIVNEMGITVDVLSDGRVQLLHTFSNAKSVSDAEEGLLFMQEMVELSKSQSSDTLPQSVSFVVNGQKVVLSAGPAHFGKQLRNADKVIGRVGVAHPLRACEPLTNPEWLHGRIGIVERGDCMFVEKARKLASAGAIGGIVVDNVPGSSAGGSPMFAMSGDGIDNVDIPVVFLFSQDAWRLLQALAQNPVMLVTLGDTLTEAKSETEGKTDDETSTLQKLKGSVQDFLFVQQDKPIIESVGKPEVTLVDIGDVSSGQEMIRISRRDAYLSSEGTAVVPPAVLTRETLHALLLEMLSKPQSGLDEDISAKDDIVQVTSQNRIGVKSPDEL